MPRKISEKCRQCSKLSADDAKLKDCWEGEPCYQRRYNYRNREKRNYDRRSARQNPEIESPVIESVAPVVVYWRETKNSPVHAIGAQLQSGTKVILSATPRHCLGAGEGDIHDWLRAVLKDFRQHYGKSVGKFVRGGIEHHPLLCPLCRIESDCN